MAFLIGFVSPSQLRPRKEARFVYASHLMAAGVLALGVLPLLCTACRPAWKTTQRGERCPGTA